ncbi:hypothetical protein BLNAU_2749 [Blattamonas nauphoetae]|uniref:Uncharacterized protein n=1 Tax=Blattamonas nauphoetae TaxID=2049346 RepID=A0ABQ9YER0_9EUKA|nr:hypothetical protein BLNAU_2749 [Blattamonas nauphoetae]
MILQVLTCVISDVLGAEACSKIETPSKCVDTRFCIYCNNTKNLTTGLVTNQSACMAGGQAGANKDDIRNGDLGCALSDTYWLTEKANLPSFTTIALIAFLSSVVGIQLLCALLVRCLKKR